MYYRQPEYFKDFRCKGGECIYTCCAGWNIDWTKEEIDKIKNASACSDELRTLMENSFEESEQENGYKVKLGNARRCPFLTEDNLCCIQKELGEEYLSYTCTSYPRQYRAGYEHETDSNPCVYRYCYPSCPEVSKRLVEDKNAMRLVNIPVKTPEVLRHVHNDKGKYDSNPELKYRTELFEFFYNLISDTRYSVEAVLINGAIAAKILDEIVEQKNYDMIPSAINELHEGFIKGGLFQNIEQIKPDYVMKVGFVSKVIRALDGNNAIGMLRTPEGKLDLKKYLIGEKNLNDMFGGEDWWLRNIALNFLFEMHVPFNPMVKCTLFESYSLFLTVVACAKLNAAAAMSNGDQGINARYEDGFGIHVRGKEKVYGFTSIISRSLSQSKGKSETILAILREMKFTKPADLSLLIK